MLTSKEIKELRNHLINCENPLFFFDADADGLSSFLLAKKFTKKGNGVFVKGTAELNSDYLNRVKEYSPDKIFVFDKPSVSQDFIDNVNVPIIWVDHHPVVKRSGIIYYNPLKHKSGKSYPTTYWLYKATQENLWIATLGCIADYHIPDFINDFIKEYPDLFDKKIKHPGKALYETKIGYLVKLVSFSLKNKTAIINWNIRMLLETESPYEILNQTTKQGELLYERSKKIENPYNELLEKALSQKSKKKLFLFTYSDKKYSFSKELSNELLYKHSKNIIIVARYKEDDVLMSLRSATIPISPILSKVISEFQGAHGGGHEFACGAFVKKEDFIDFIEKFEKNINSKAF